MDLCLKFLFILASLLLSALADVDFFSEYQLNQQILDNVDLAKLRQRYNKCVDELKYNDQMKENEIPSKESVFLYKSTKK